MTAVGEEVVLDVVQDAAGVDGTGITFGFGTAVTIGHAGIGKCDERAGKGQNTNEGMHAEQG